MNRADGPDGPGSTDARGHTEALLLEIDEALTRAEHCLDALDVAPDDEDVLAGPSSTAQENRAIRITRSHLAKQAAREMRAQLHQVRARATTMAEQARVVRGPSPQDGGRPAPERARSAAATVVARATAFTDAHAGDDIGIADIAAACGVSTRRLQEAFRAQLGTTPSSHLRRTRLARAHAELQAADPVHDTVAAIAARWGFAHPARFAGAYRRAYGQPPSHTLYGITTSQR